MCVGRGVNVCSSVLEDVLMCVKGCVDVCVGRCVRVCVGRSADVC